MKSAAFTKVPAFVLGIVLGVCTTPAMAVHDEDFELDNGVTGGNIINDGVLPVDWEDLFDVPVGAVAQAANSPTPKGVLPLNFGPATFIRDFVPGASGPDTSTFATGSKDTLNITPGWECAQANNTNDKIDIVNAYATRWVDPGTGEEILYFAMERYSNEGDANIAFWFLQDETVACVPSGPGGGGTESFTGNHVDGDLLIVSEFSNGGVVSTINAYEWVGGAGGALNPVPIASGADCGTALAGDALCATVNKENLVGGANGGADIPWLTETKQPGNTPSNDLDISEFYEGGLNLNQVGLSGLCFAKFMGVTRSSTSLTATLFDYALGDFPTCSLDVAKVCQASTQQDPNPVVDGDGVTVITKFDVTITPEGGPLFDAVIREDVTFADLSGSLPTAVPDAEFCEITAVGGVPVGPVDLPSGTYVAVPTAQGAINSPVTVEITCDTASNPFINQVTAGVFLVDQANPLTNPPDLSDSSTINNSGSGGGASCAAAPDPTISVTKVCRDIVLMETGNPPILGLVVVVDVSATNTSVEQLNGVLVTDSDVGTLLTGGTLAPSETVSFQGLTYMPSAPDQGPIGLCMGTGDALERCEVDGECPSQETGSCVVADKYDPPSAMFTDTANASGVGAISSKPAVSGPSSDTCDLCPQ